MDDHALDDEPMTLEEACEVIFKGAIKPATLRAEAERGTLILERIGRRDFVTRTAIREMRRKCQVVPPQKVPDSGSSLHGSGRMAASPRPAGASGTTDDTSAALNSVLRNVEALKQRSRATSPKSTRSRPASLSLVKG